KVVRLLEGRRRVLEPPCLFQRQPEIEVPIGPIRIERQRLPEFDLGLLPAPGLVVLVRSLDVMLGVKPLVHRHPSPPSKPQPAQGTRRRRKHYCIRARQFDPKSASFFSWRTPTRSFTKHPTGMRDSILRRIVPPSSVSFPSATGGQTPRLRVQDCSMLFH